MHCALCLSVYNVGRIMMKGGGEPERLYNCIECVIPLCNTTSKNFRISISSAKLMGWDVTGYLWLV